MKIKVNTPHTTHAATGAGAFQRPYASALESDMDLTEPQEGSNLGRVFTFLFLLHSFIIGAVVMYNVLTDKPRPAVTATSTVTQMKKSDKTPAATDQQAPATNTAPVIKEETTEFIVSSGQSLRNIAEKTGATQEDIIRLNNLENNGELFVGRKLIVPKRKDSVVAAIPVPAASVAPAAVSQSSKVVPLSVAAKTDTNKPAPEKAVTKVAETPPAPAPAKAPAGLEELPPPLTPPGAKPGAKTVLEAPPAPAVVKNTEEPAATKPEPEVEKPVVAKQTEAPVKKKAVPVQTPAASKAVAKTSASKGGKYVVKSKDTFYGIASKHGVSATALMKANGYKDAGALRVGSTLTIPKK